ncbi:YraN family protein [Treponema sp. HNW]|uniref:YraN family protein n=1 Tax=Treponema sp. HNW TaxID=3116654 RepID=UPI003D0D77AE
MPGALNEQGPQNNTKTGKKGEVKAEKYLIDKGYTLICRNWRTRSGEIDLIAEKDGILVFCEVKTLPHSPPGSLEYVLNTRKQRKIIETAKRFLLDNRQYSNSYIRFDVLVIDVPPYSPVYHIENAFSEFI